ITCWLRPSVRTTGAVGAVSWGGVSAMPAYYAEAGGGSLFAGLKYSWTATARGPEPRKSKASGIDMPPARFANKAASTPKARVEYLMVFLPAGVASQGNLVFPSILTRLSNSLKMAASAVATAMSFSVDHLVLAVVIPFTTSMAPATASAAPTFLAR